MTPRQKKAAKIMVEDIGGLKSKGEILKEAGYGKNRQRIPAKVMNSEGFRQALIISLRQAGLTPEKLAERLNWLMDGAEKESETATLGAIREISKMAGLYAPTQVESKVDIDVMHRVEDDEGNYAEFLKQQNMKREVVEGEIIS